MRKRNGSRTRSEKQLRDEGGSEVRKTREGRMMCEKDGGKLVNGRGGANKERREGRREKQE